VKRVEFEDEKGVVAEAVGGAFEAADLVVDAFEFSAGDGEVEVIEDAQGMGAKRLGKAHHLDDAALQRFGTPVLQKCAHGAQAWLAPEQPQFFLEVVGSRERLVESQRLGKLFALGLGEVLGSHQEQVAAAFDGVALQNIGLSPQRPAQFVELFVDQLDDVEVIENQCRLWQVFQDGAPVGCGHVAGGGFDACVALAHPPPELAQCLGSSPFGDMDDVAAIQVDDQGVELGFCADVDFVDGNALDLLEREAFVAFGEVLFDDLLDRVPAQVGQGSHVDKRHQAAQSADESSQG
jgi:hypothetical protein